MIDCKICSSKTQNFFHPKLEKLYHHCKNCDFIFLDPSFYVSHDAEKKQYDQHNNTIENDGYVQMFESFISFIQLHTGTRPLRCLDFGSGPGPVLSQLLAGHGHDVSIYDPFFAPFEKILASQYDLITSTEVIEHLKDPIVTLSKLITSLHSDGFLALMTQFHPQNQEAFTSWWYPRDPTHISFFSTKTLAFLAKALQLKLIDHNEKSYLILKK